MRNSSPFTGNVGLILHEAYSMSYQYMMLNKLHSLQEVVLICVSYLQVDISASLAYEMSIKEESEIKLMQKASQITCDVFAKYLRDQIMEIIDAEKVQISKSKGIIK